MNGRTRSLGLLVGVLVAVSVTWLPKAAATPSTAVTITIDQHLTGPTTLSGTWTASGAISDSGTYAEEFRLSKSGAIQGVKVLMSPTGTITLAAVGLLVFTGPTTAVVEGRWAIISGTGGYSRLHAEGSLTVTVDFATGTALAIHQGVAHFD